MDKTELNILLIEDNPADVIFLREALAQDAQADFRLTMADTLGEALALLAEQPFDAALLDLGLPDSQGLSTFLDLHRAAPDVPVVVLSALDDEDVAMQSMQAGAQDYLVKRPREFPVAGRALRYAIERQKSRSALQASERRFSILFHSNPVPVGLTRASDFRIVDVNAAWEDLTGYTRAEALGKTSSELGLARADTLQCVREALGTQDKLNRFELRLYTRAGNERTVLVSSEQIELDGQVYYLNTLLDITERKQAEHALEQTRNTLAEAQKIAHMGSFEYIAATQTTVWSEEEFRIYGLDPAGQSPAYDEMLQKSIHPDDVALLNDVFTKALQQGAVYELEHRIVHPDGSVRWVYNRAQPYYGEHGEIERYIGTTVDITERKQAEQNLRESETRFATIFRASPLGIILTQLEDGVVVDVNDALLRLIGYQREEVIGRTTTQLHLYADPKDRQRMVAKILEQGSLLYEEANFRRKSGEIGTVLLSAEIIELAGKENLLTLMVDITERKQGEEILREREELLSMMGRTAHVGGWDFDVATGNGHWTEEVARIHDLDPATQPTREIGLSFFAGKSKERIVTAVKDASEQGIPYDLELEFISATGKHKWIRTIGHPVMENGRVVRLHGSFQDITERKRSETLLNQHLEDLALINNLNDAVNHGEGLDQVTVLLASETKKIFKSQYASVYLIHPETQTLVLEQFTMPRELIARLEKLLGRQVPQVHIPLDGDDHFNRVLNTDQGLLITGDEAVQRWLSDFTNTSFLPASVRPLVRRFIPAAAKLLNVRSVISIPLRAGNEALGLIEFATDSEFDESALERLRNVRHQLAEVIIRKRAEQALRASNEQYRLLSEELEERVRQRTAEVQDLYDNAPAGYHSLDQDGIVTQINQTELNWLGYSRAEVLGRRFIEFISAPSREVFAENLPILRRDGQMHNIEIEFVRKDGSTFPALVNSVAVFDADGNFAQSRTTVFDITERKQADRAIREREAQLRLSRDKLSAANAALEKAARMKDEFMANMSHELRTPLTGILGMSELLQLNVYGPLTEKQKTAILNIERSGRHLLELINDILDLSKIEAGMLDLNIEPVALNDICQASLQLTKGMAHKKQQTVRFSMEPPSILVRADVRRLKQMLVNLLSNAIKFTPQNRALGLDVQADEEAQIVRLAVWDTGIGIAPEHLEQLFQPFVQLDSNLSRQYEGTGLGLSLVLHMAELHGGSVEVESTPGEGSRFTIVLPWRSEDNRPAATSHAGSVSLRKALVVENNEIDAELVTSYLQRLGMEVILLETDQDVVERAAQEKPDVVLLDLQLPDRSGLDILTDLQAHPATHAIPVICCSVEEKRPQAMALGAVGYLIRPLSLPELCDELGKVADALAQRSAEAQLHDASQPMILVVDDNEMILEMICDLLASQNYGVTAARSGAELLEIVQELHPDIILVDIQMPVIDGLDAIRRIRAHRDQRVSQVPIVALTGLAMTGDRERCLAAGANAYMSKPVDMKRLVVTVGELTSRPTQFKEVDRPVVGSMAWRLGKAGQ